MSPKKKWWDQTGNSLLTEQTRYLGCRKTKREIKRTDAHTNHEHSHTNYQRPPDSLMQEHSRRGVSTHEMKSRLVINMLRPFVVCRENWERASQFSLQTIAIFLDTNETWGLSLQNEFEPDTASLTKRAVLSRRRSEVLSQNSLTSGILLSGDFTDSITLYKNTVFDLLQIIK